MLFVDEPVVLDCFRSSNDRPAWIFRLFLASKNSWGPKAPPFRLQGHPFLLACFHYPPPEKHLHIPLKIDNWVRWMNIFFLDDQNFRGHIHHFNFFGGVLLGHVSPCFSKPWAISQDTSPDLPPLWWNSSTYHPPLRRYPPGSCSAFLELLRHWKPKGMQQRNIII